MESSGKFGCNFELDYRCLGWIITLALILLVALRRNLVLDHGYERCIQCKTN